MYKLLFVVFITFFLYSCGNIDSKNDTIGLKSSRISSVTHDSKNSRMSINSAVINKDYKFNFKSSKIIADEYLLYGGDLPKGLTLDSTTGVISGSPAESGNFNFEIGLKNSDSDDIKIIPFNISVDKLVNLYKSIESFIDISKTKQDSLHELGNGGQILFSKPFFSFYGTPVSSLTVCQEGYIKIGATSCNPAADIDGGQNVIAPFADSALKLTSNSKIYYQERGLSPRRMLIIQYKNLERDGDSDSEYNFEIIIHEDSGNIQFLYNLSHPGLNGNSNDRAYLGAHAFIGVTSLSKKFEVIKNQPKIFRGTVITLHAPPANTDLNYNSGTKWLNNRYITSNVVSDYIDIARYNKNAKVCTSNSNCPLSNKCIDGYEGKRCASLDLTDSLIYGTNFQVSLPFTFKYYGNSYNDFYVTENGYIYFGAKNSSNINFPHKNNSVHLKDIPVNNSLLPMFSDINLKSTMGGHVTYNVVGTSPKRRAIVMYDEVRISDGNTIHNCSFELVLHENSNVIEFLYGGGNESDVCLGRASTVGLKKDNNDFIEIAANNRALGQGKSITFVPDNDTASSYTWVGVGNEKPDGAFPNSKDINVRSIYLNKVNASFIDLPLRDIEINPVPTDFGEDIEELYLSGTQMKPYSIYDLDNANGSGYTFKFKGKLYNKLFVDGHGAVSFGNADTAEMVIAPMWGDVYYQSELESLDTPYEDVENDFMWIANSAGDSLSKINTHTGVLIGEYSVGDNPSRTAVGFDGSVWVGNRNSDDVTKLSRNGDFVCNVYLNSGCGPRGLALDKDENLWVGCYNGGYIYKMVDTKIEPSKDNNYAPRCRILDLRAPSDHSSNLAFKGNSYGTYGLAFDKHGILWSSGLGYHRTIRIDTNKNPGENGFYKSYPSPGNKTTYGIVVDYEDRLWYGSWYNGNIGVIRDTYNSSTDSLTPKYVAPVTGGNTPSGGGVAIDRQGNIWVAHGSTNQIGKYAPDGTALALFNINTNTGANGSHDCDYPHGVGVDGDGDIWANCLRNGHSEELDPNTGEELSNFYTGPSPYCYSDNTGFSLRNITSNLKKTKFSVRTAKYKVYDPDQPSKCIRIERKLIVQWDNVRMKRVDANGNSLGYTESTFEIIFDNGRSLVSFPNDPDAPKCDENNLQEDTNRDVTITYVYGGVKGSDYDLKTGVNTETALKAIYAIDQNKLQYEHIIGNHDAGTINSGSKFVISSSK